MSEINRYDGIYESLRSKILTDEYRPGQKLSENSLAEEHGCSRTPIREVLKRLESNGLVIVKPRSGTYVSQETRAEFEELIQVRAYLESLAYRLALAAITPRQLRGMESIKREMDSIAAGYPIDMAKFAALHYDFHLQLIRVSGNDLLAKHYERLNLRSSHMFYQFMDSETAGMTQDEHEQILDGLRRRDPAGEEFMRRHLWHKMERI